MDIEEFPVNDYNITDISPTHPIHRHTSPPHGRGIARVSYDNVDGFTGASGFGLPWSQVTSNNVQSIAVKGDIQWVGTSLGANRHTTNMAKEGWGKYSLDSGLVDTNVIAVHIDDDDNVWLGTTSGLSVIAGVRSIQLYGNRRTGQQYHQSYHFRHEGKCVDCHSGRN